MARIALETGGLIAPSLCTRQVGLADFLNLLRAG
jgi:hypothetical protein